MKKLITYICIAVMLLSMTACGKTELEGTAITIEKDGKVNHVIVESFEDGYFLDDLKDMIQREVKEYNKYIVEGEIEVGAVEQLENGDVFVSMVYPSVADFSAFANKDNEGDEMVFFYGKVEDAFSLGYDLDVKMYAPDSEDEYLGRNDILEMGEKNILIYDAELNLGEKISIVAPGKIAYISDGVDVLNKNVIQMTQTEGLSYVIYK